MRDITLGETFYHFFATRSFATGVPTTLAGTPALSVLEENNATPITAGVSLSVDRASVAGLNQATIVATSGNGFEAGKSYAIYVSTGTVGGTSVVGEIVGEFTVQASAAFTRLGAPAGASTAADIAAAKVDTAAIKTKTDFLPSVTAGAAGGVFIAGSNAATSITTGLTANIIGNITGALSGSVGSVTAGVTLAASAIQAIWDALTSALTTVGSIGKRLADNIDATVSSRSTYAGGAVASVTADVGITQAGADKVWSSATRTLSAFSTALAVSVWDVLASAVATASSIGLQIKTNLDAAITSRLATSGYTAPPTVNAIADQVWDEVMVDHLTGGSTGASLNGAGAAGDPWTTPLPGAYGAGTAGKIVGDNINATVSSRAPEAGGNVAAILAAVDTEVAAILAAVDTEIADIKAKTDQMTFTLANKLDVSVQAAADITAAVANKIADHVLRRAYANARASANGDTVDIRSLLGGEAKLINRVKVNGANLDIYHEDDTTVFASQAITTSAGADPITELDPL